MSFFDNFPQETLVDLLKAYDSYISTAAAAGLLTTGWTPVCISEFYDCEYQNVWDPEKGDESFYYMYENVEAMLSAESRELPVPDEFYFNSMTFSHRDGQFFCRFFGEAEMRPIRSRIQDIEAGDAFIASNGVYYATEASHQNFDEPDEPWIVYDQGDIPWFEEDIVPAEKGIQSFLQEIQENKASHPSLDALISSAEGKTAAPSQPSVEDRSTHR